MDFQEKRKRFWLLQVNDALFPIGAYSHSYGLETYIQKGLVNTPKEAWDFLRRRMLYGFCHNELLSAKLAYEYAGEGRVDKLAELEDLLDACRVPREVREAGRKLGSRFVKTVREMDIVYETEVFRNYIADRKDSFMTHSVAYGVFCRAAGISSVDFLDHYLYAQTSSMVTNCVKTIPLSQTDGQRLLSQSHALFREVLDRLDTLTEEDLCMSVPGFDIRCMQHEGLYSRLYMS